MNTNVLRKSLVVGIILLFVAIAYSPAIHAYDDSRVCKVNSIPKNEDTVSITVLEYKPDGTIGKSVVKLSKIQAEKLRGELNNIKDLDTRLSICKKYNLIPQDVTAETVRAGMGEKAQRLGLTKEKLQQLASSNFEVYKQKNKRFDIPYTIRINILSAVSGYSAFCIPILLGLSLFTMFLNSVPYEQHKPMNTSIDLSDRLIGEIYIVSSGILPTFDIDVIGFVKLVGFVGFFILDSAVWDDGSISYGIIFLGFAAYVRTFGIEV